MHGTPTVEALKREMFGCVMFRLFFTFTAYTFGIARTNFYPLNLPTLNVTAFTLQTVPSSKRPTSPSRGRCAPAIQNETPAKSLT